MTELNISDAACDFLNCGVSCAVSDIETILYYISTYDNRYDIIVVHISHNKFKFIYLLTKMYVCVCKSNDKICLE